MPNNDAQSGPDAPEVHPMDLLALEVIRVCNACLRNEITLDAWEQAIRELEQRGMMR